MRYDAVLFDNDGVLVHPTDVDVLRTAAWRAFDALGVADPDPADVEAMMLGVTPATLEEVCGRYDVDPATFFETRDRLCSECQREEARAGRKRPYDDVSALRSLEVPLGVVSSNQQATVDFLFDHFGLAGLFGAAYGRQPTVESLRLKKPEPHYLDLVLTDLGLAVDGDPAPDVLFVGDNESDLVAAANAGVDSAFIRRPHRVDHALSVDPTHDIESLHDLQSLEPT